MYRLSFTYEGHVPLDQTCGPSKRLGRTASFLVFVARDGTCLPAHMVSSRLSGTGAMHVLESATLSSEVASVIITVAAE